ncbi:hypothetical protein L195_g014537 [Trifolium pratense]|uniref:Uncharacterized protein n=1 Tax=Trifolium pratense TaxID=57577 RepID=A0A2K3PR75_TRIPR|nr:hypothetical protein L195_g014537 [Trifolium pratense]
MSVRRVVGEGDRCGSGGTKATRLRRWPVSGVELMRAILRNTFAALGLVVFSLGLGSVLCYRGAGSRAFVLAKYRDLVASHIIFARLPRGGSISVSVS